jgi:hypothetical protein
MTDRATRERQYPELPSHEELLEAALRFIAGRRTYMPAEMRAALAEVFEISPEHLALKFHGGALAWVNYIAHVLRQFNLNEFHTRHVHGKDVWYTVTELGMAAGKTSLDGPAPNGLLDGEQMSSRT